MVKGNKVKVGIVRQTRAEVAPMAEAVTEESKYLYCVVDAGEGVSLGKIGIDKKEVYTIPYKDISAVVHDCPAKPYQSDDEEVVKSWVVAHQEVVEACWHRWGTILPFSFNTIIKGEGETNAEQNLKEWLKQEYERLKSKLDSLRGKAEYGVQVFWNPKVIAENLSRSSPEIKKLKEEIELKPKGTAYMLRQKLEQMLRRELELKAEEYFKDFYSRIRKHVDDIRVEKTKKGEADRQMLMNLSCLVDKDREKFLGEELEGISRLEGFSVRFTGPWPPYSFV